MPRRICTGITRETTSGMPDGILVVVPEIPEIIVIIVRIGRGKEFLKRSQE